MCIRPHICSFMYYCIARPLIVRLRPFYLCYNVSALLFPFLYKYASFSSVIIISVGLNIPSQCREFGLGPLQLVGAVGSTARQSASGPTKQGAAEGRVSTRLEAARERKRFLLGAG